VKSKENPAPRANAGCRAITKVCKMQNSAFGSDLEAEYAGAIVAQRFRIATQLARVVIELARIGRAFA
jgi:hypothetical protein